jgi:hypothetical protein
MKWALAAIVALIMALMLFRPSNTGRYQIVSPSDAFFVHRLNTSTGEIQTLVLGRPDVERKRYEFQEIAVWPRSKEGNRR